MAEAVVRLKVDATNANKALNGVQKRTEKLQGAFGGLKTAIAGIGIGLLAKQAVNTSANFEKLNVTNISPTWFFLTPYYSSSWG